MMARPKPAPEPDRYEPCERCGQAYLTAAWWQDTPICCYCYNQAKRLVGQCVECGHSGIVPGRTTAGHYLCRTCSGIQLNVDCVECGAEAELYRHGHCWRCELTHQVDELLTNPPTGTINPQLVGLAEALKQMPRPNSGVTWLRNPTVRTILQEIAAADTVDQQLLDLYRSIAQPCTSALCSMSTGSLVRGWISGPDSRRGPTASSPR